MERGGGTTKNTPSNRKWVEWGQQIAHIAANKQAHIQDFSCREVQCKIKKKKLHLKIFMP